MEDLNSYKITGLEIDLDNLAYNMKQVAKIVKEGTLITAIVKANGYGHGAIDVAKVFLENGAHRLAVSTLEEGIELRKGGIDVPILLLNHTFPERYDDILYYDLIPSIYRYNDAIELSKEAVKLEKIVKIHIKIDTGMGRIGFLPIEDSIKDIIEISKLPNIEIEGMFSHFARADEEDKSHVKEQYKRFSWVTDRLEENNIYIPIKHISNSAGIMDTPEYNMDMVRAGIILYGYYPSDEVMKDRLKLKPAMTLKSYISNIKIVEEGAGIGYNQIFTTDRRSVIGTIPIGYADGYSRILTGKGEVSIHGKRVPIIGRICMDQMMLDLTDIDDLKIGDRVVLFGHGDESYPSVEEVAKTLGTVSYEIMCMMGRRLPRIYIKEGNISNVINYILD
ncbi:alanine racemase [Tissierellaceae bacterium HCP3S3_D8]